MQKSAMNIAKITAVAALAVGGFTLGAAPASAVVPVSASHTAPAASTFLLDGDFLNGALISGPLVSAPLVTGPLVTGPLVSIPFGPLQLGQFQ